MEEEPDALDDNMRASHLAFVHHTVFMEEMVPQFLS
jgi:hypothetical protein